MNGAYPLVVCCSAQGRNGKKIYSFSFILFVSNCANSSLYKVTMHRFFTLIGAKISKA